MPGKGNLIHGDSINSNSPYETWRNMKYRCDNIKNPSYKSYGGRGIRVCDEWREYKVFKTWAINHGWKKGLTIDRINNNGDYEPGNCRFITRSENTKKLVRFGGPTAKMSYETVYIIRFLYGIGIPRKNLMKQFELSNHQIGKIVNYKAWKEEC